MSSGPAELGDESGWLRAGSPLFRARIASHPHAHTVPTAPTTRVSCADERWCMERGGECAMQWCSDGNRSGVGIGEAEAD